MNSWKINEDDVEMLRLLSGSVYRLTSIAQSGKHLIALGEVIEAIESLLESEEIDINVGLNIGFRRGDIDFKEGLYICLRINSYEIILDELHTSYSSDVGSDHFTISYVNFTPRSNLNHLKLTEWIEMLSEISSIDETKLTVSRDHI
jgi:hypothetical protein